MDYPEREALIGYMPGSGKTLWTPVMAPVRKTERFKAFARNTGLVDYWRAKGWPEFPPLPTISPASDGRDG